MHALYELELHSPSSRLEHQSYHGIAHHTKSPLLSNVVSMLGRDVLAMVTPSVYTKAPFPSRFY